MAKKKKKKKQHRFFWFIVKVQIFLFIVVLAGLAYYYYGGYAKEVQTLHNEAIAEVAASDAKTFVPAQRGEIYDANGTMISELHGSKKAEYVYYEDIPIEFVSAMVSIEDKKFFRHKGVDYKAIGRAAKAIIEDGKISQGGSTITMQLARNIYLDTDKNWRRKVKEMFIATELEKRYSKEKIMEFYLNNIYFSNGYYGIEAACHGYFDCELQDLTLSQVAFLCAIPNSPTYYDPFVYPENTRERRNRILRNMYEDELISKDEYDVAVAEDIMLNPRIDDTKINNYVDTYVYYCATRALMENEGFEFRYYFDSDEEEDAYDEEYDEMYAYCQKQLYAGGYKIYTSIDMNKQALLQQTVDNQLAEFTEKSEEGIYSLQASATCIDNETGYVVAIVGGRDQDFSSYTLNRAYQSHRQPGSTIKPLIVYTPAFEKGYTPDSVLVDEEIKDGPENATKTYMGEVSIRVAVEKSLNTIAWKLYDEITPEAGLQYLKNMNFTQIYDTDYTMATSIGGFTTGMSSLEMASAYATLENDGLYRTPTCIKTIVDSDENIVYASSQVGTVIYNETAARTMTDVLKGVLVSGTGTYAKLDTMPCAAKTGTTNDQKDSWFCGYTRYYTTAVWMGYDMPRAMEGSYAGRYPGMIWKTYMDQVNANLPVLEFLPYAQMSEEFRNGETQKEETPAELETPEVPETPQAPDNVPNNENNQNNENQ